MLSYQRAIFRNKSNQSKGKWDVVHVYVRNVLSRSSDRKEAKRFVALEESRDEEAGTLGKRERRKEAPVMVSGRNRVVAPSAAGLLSYILAEKAFH